MIKLLYFLLLITNFFPSITEAAQKTEDSQGIKTINIELQNTNTNLITIKGKTTTGGEIAIDGEYWGLEKSKKPNKLVSSKDVVSAFLKDIPQTFFTRLKLNNKDLDNNPFNNAMKDDISKGLVMFLACNTLKEKYNLSSNMTINTLSDILGLNSTRNTTRFNRIISNMNEKNLKEIVFLKDTSKILDNKPNKEHITKILRYYDSFSRFIIPYLVEYYQKQLPINNNVMKEYSKNIADTINYAIENFFYSPIKQIGCNHDYRFALSYVKNFVYVVNMDIIPKMSTYLNFDCCNCGSRKHEYSACMSLSNHSRVNFQPQDLYNSTFCEIITGCFAISYQPCCLLCCVLSKNTRCVRDSSCNMQKLGQNICTELSASCRCCDDRYPDKGCCNQILFSCNNKNMIGINRMIPFVYDVEGKKELHESIKNDFRINFCEAIHISSTCRTCACISTYCGSGGGYDGDLTNSAICLCNNNNPYEEISEDSSVDYTIQNMHQPNMIKPNMVNNN